MRIELTEIINQKNNRTAKVIKTPEGFEAEFYENNELVETRVLHQYTEDYTQDACENWVEKVIKSPGQS